MQTQSIANHHIKPHTGQVLVQLHDGREKDSLVLVPDSAKNKVNPFGLVISVGPEVQNILPGDKLIFMPNSMLIEITLDGEKCVFVKAEQVLGKYVPNADPSSN